MKKIEEKLNTSKLDITPGDTVKVSIKITEAGKERTQIFEGVVIAVNGKGASKSITVRKVSHGIGVEKIFPLNSPIIKKIELTEKGHVRRAKLYYMRKRVGKRSLDVTLDESYEGEVDDMTESPVVEEVKSEETEVKVEKNIEETATPEEKKEEKKEEVEAEKPSVEKEVVKE